MGDLSEPAAPNIGGQALPETEPPPGRVWPGGQLVFLSDRTMVWFPDWAEYLDDEGPDDGAQASQGDDQRDGARGVHDDAIGGGRDRENSSSNRGLFMDP